MKRLGFAIWCGAWAACQVPNPAYLVAGGGDDLGDDAQVADSAQSPHDPDAASPPLDAPSFRADASAPPSDVATPLPDAASPPPDSASAPPDTAPLFMDAPGELASLAEGLIAHITADEGTGTWLSDKTGGPAMEARPVFSWVAGRAGVDSAIRFASKGWAGTYPRAASEAVRNLSSQMSVAVWLNWEAPNGADQALSGYAGKLWYLRLGTNSFRRVCVTLTLDEPIASCGTRDVPLNQWVHVAFTWDNEFLRLFVDGQLQVSRPATGTLRSHYDSHLSIGAIGVAGNPLYGALNDFRIYNRALSAAEVAALAR